MFGYQNYISLSLYGAPLIFVFVRNGKNWVKTVLLKNEKKFKPNRRTLFLIVSFGKLTPHTAYASVSFIISSLSFLSSSIFASNSSSYSILHLRSLGRDDSLAWAMWPQWPPNDLHGSNFGGRDLCCARDHGDIWFLRAPHPPTPPSDDISFHLHDNVRVPMFLLCSLPSFFIVLFLY